MTQNKITVEYARQKLGNRGKKLSDKEISDYLNFLRIISNKAIDTAIETTDKKT